MYVRMLIVLIVSMRHISQESLTESIGKNTHGMTHMISTLSQIQ